MNGMVCTVTTFFHTFMWGMLAGGIIMGIIALIFIIIIGKQVSRK